jgi:hypothetical protein
MCASLMNPARPKWHADEEHATDAERLSAASGFFAYCGTYRVYEENKVIMHYPEVSLFPNFIGTEQKRPYHFEGNRLIFSHVEAEGEVERWTITWEKASSVSTAPEDTGSKSQPKGQQ